MKSFKSLSALIVLAFGMVSTLQAQKKLANDIYTYNYAGIINKNNGIAHFFYILHRLRYSFFELSA